jgi:hypothetical protein
LELPILFALTQVLSNTFVVSFEQKILLALFGVIGFKFMEWWCYGVLSNAVVEIQDDMFTVTKFLVKKRYWKKDFQFTHDYWAFNQAVVRSPFHSYKHQIFQFITKEEYIWLMSEINTFIDRSPKQNRSHTAQRN